MKFSDRSPLAILRERTVMCIPQVTLQFFVSSYGRQQKSEFKNDDSITGIDLPSMDHINYYGFLSLSVVESNRFNGIRSYANSSIH